MRKIPTLFERDWTGDRSRVVDQINPACAWVAAGEGIATRKVDGTCCLIRGGKLYKRRELKQSDTDPDGFEQTDYDLGTGKRTGWVPVGNGSEDLWHREAFGHLSRNPLVDGTYELVGPKIQGNPEGVDLHILLPHSGLLGFPDGAADPPRTFEALKAWMTGQDIEGVVWHHPDGRMAKIKLRDFGLKRRIRP